LYINVKIWLIYILDSLGGRDYDSLSLGVRNSSSGGGAFAADFRSGLGNYLFFKFIYDP